MRLGRKVSKGRIVALACAACWASQCSLLAPGDDAFLDGGGGGGGGEVGGQAGGGGGAIEPGCEPAPPCGDPPTTATPDIGPMEAEALVGLVANAEPGTTIFLDSGTYPLSAPLSFKRPGVTLASASGNPADVTLDGGGLEVIVAIAASDVTLRGITIRNASQSAILIGDSSGAVTSGTRLCDVHVEDGGTAFVQAKAGFGWSDCGRVERSSIRLTDAGRAAACSAPAPGEKPFVSGISIAGGRNWVVRKTEFRDIHCIFDDVCGEGDGIAALFVTGARGTLFENNRIFGAFRGLALGYTITTTLPRTYADAPYPEITVDHYDGIVRNNIIFGMPACFDTGIELNHARRPEVLHNTIVQPDGQPKYAAIDRRYPGTDAAIRNNLVRGPIMIRSRAPVTLEEANVLVDTLDNYFVSAGSENFHLKFAPTADAAVGTGVLSAIAGEDIDGTPRDADGAPDVGADER